MHVVLAEYKHRTKDVLFPKELTVSQTQPYRCDTVWFWNLTGYFKTKRQQQQPSVGWRHRSALQPPRLPIQNS